MGCEKEGGLEMPKIIVEFYASDANNRAREWRQQLIATIEKAISDLNNHGIRIFLPNEFSVYMSFEEG